ncbi:hypothetical protein [Streptosporangium subroseum]|uniref:hypothetical protein n=1 Tax=Streptosporangium subroseum TaxID=106412 RepID=UPI00308FC36A|nr:hypothetical protein OHB15_14000 [Streptosporangium subroseum]
MPGTSTPCVTKAPPAHGPADALHPVGELEELPNTPPGIRIRRQAYADGHIYEYTAHKGAYIDPESAYFSTPFAQGRILKTYAEGDYNYLSIWVPLSDPGASVSGEAVEMPEIDPSAAEVELLHQDDRFVISRQRLATGWLYLIDAKLGFPWPSFYDIPAIKPTRFAPVVSIDRTGTGYHTKFWVADTQVPQQG